MSSGYRFLSVPVSDADTYVLDKEKSTTEFATYFLLRVMKMFHYEGLPEEIPEDCLNKMLLTEGFVFFTKWKGTTLRGEERDQFYVFRGNLGDVIDAYYRPTKIIIANPGANCLTDFILDKQKRGTYYGEKGVIIRNDTLYHGLMPLIKRYAYLLAENVLTMRSADVFLRIIALISGQDDKTLLSANEFIKSIENGKMMAVSEGKFFEGVKMQSPPSNNGSYLTQFIEYQQYFLGSFFNEIGLNANFNMKRESIAKSESSLNEDSMLPLCQNMLKCRQEDFDVVNEMFGLNIKVSFDSAWLQNALEVVMELERMRSESEGASNGNMANGAGDSNLANGAGDSKLANGAGDSNMANGAGDSNMANSSARKENGDDKTAEENQGTEEVLGGESGTGRKDETVNGGDSNQDGVQSGTGDSTEKEGTPEENSLTEKDQIVTDELIKRAAGLDAMGDEAGEDDTANELADNNEEEKKDESNK